MIVNLKQIFSPLSNIRTECKQTLGPWKSYEFYVLYVTTPLPWEDIFDRIKVLLDTTKNY